MHTLYLHIPITKHYFPYFIFPDPPQIYPWMKRVHLGQSEYCSFYFPMHYPQKYLKLSICTNIYEAHIKKYRSTKRKEKETESD